MEEGEELRPTAFLYFASAQLPEVAQWTVAGIK